MDLIPLYDRLGNQQRVVYNTMDLMIFRRGAKLWNPVTRTAELIGECMPRKPKGVPTKPVFRLRSIMRAETDGYLRDKKGRNRLAVHIVLDCGHEVHRQERRDALYEFGGKARCYECGEGES